MKNNVSILFEAVSNQSPTPLPKKESKCVCDLIYEGKTDAGYCHLHSMHWA